MKKRLLFIYGMISACLLIIVNVQSLQAKDDELLRAYYNPKVYNQILERGVRRLTRLVKANQAYARLRQFHRMRFVFSLNKDPLYGVAFKTRQHGFLSSEAVNDMNQLLAEMAAGNADIGIHSMYLYVAVSHFYLETNNPAALEQVEVAAKKSLFLKTEEFVRFKRKLINQIFRRGFIENDEQKGAFGAVMLVAKEVDGVISNLEDSNHPLKVTYDIKLSTGKHLRRSVAKIRKKLYKYRHRGGDVNPYNPASFFNDEDAAFRYHIVTSCEEFLWNDYAHNNTGSRFYEGTHTLETAIRQKPLLLLANPSIKGNIPVVTRSEYMNVFGKLSLAITATIAMPVLLEYATVHVGWKALAAQLGREAARKGLTEGALHAALEASIMYYFEGKSLSDIQKHLTSAKFIKEAALASAQGLFTGKLQDAAAAVDILGCADIDLGKGKISLKEDCLMNALGAYLLSKALSGNYAERLQKVFGKHRDKFVDGLARLGFACQHIERIATTLNLQIKGTELCSLVDARRKKKGYTKKYKEGKGKGKDKKDGKKDTPSSSSQLVVERSKKKLSTPSLQGSYTWLVKLKPTKNKKKTNGKPAATSKPKTLARGTFVKRSGKTKLEQYMLKIDLTSEGKRYGNAAHIYQALVSKINTEVIKGKRIKVSSIYLPKSTHRALYSFLTPPKKLTEDHLKNSKLLQIARKAPSPHTKAQVNWALGQGRFRYIAKTKDDKGIKFTQKACFVAGTLIAVKEGFKAIEQISVGDSVWSFDETTQRVFLKPVTQTFVRQASQLIALVVAQDTLYTTADHPFYSGGQWVKAGKLKQGQSVQLLNGKTCKIAALNAQDSSATVYNFTVANFHNYYVGKHQVLVHNAEEYDDYKKLVIKRFKHERSFKEPKLNEQEVEYLRKLAYNYHINNIIHPETRKEPFKKLTNDDKVAYNMRLFNVLSNNNSSDDILALEKLEDKSKPHEKFLTLNRINLFRETVGNAKNVVKEDWNRLFGYIIEETFLTATNKLGVKRGSVDFNHGLQERKNILSPRPGRVRPDGLMGYNIRYKGKKYSFKNGIFFEVKTGGSDLTYDYKIPNNPYQLSAMLSALANMSSDEDKAIKGKDIGSNQLVLVTPYYSANNNKLQQSLVDFAKLPNVNVHIYQLESFYYYDFKAHPSGVLVIIFKYKKGNSPGKPASNINGAKAVIEINKGYQVYLKNK